MRSCSARHGSVRHEGTAARLESRSAPGSAARFSRTAGSSTPGRVFRAKARCTSFRTAAGPPRRRSPAQRSSRATAIRGWTFATSRSGPETVTDARAGCSTSSRPPSVRSPRPGSTPSAPRVSSSAARSRRRGICSRGGLHAALADVDGLAEIVPARACRRRRAARRGAPCGRDGRPPSPCRSMAVSARRLAEHDGRRGAPSTRPRSARRARSTLASKRESSQAACRSGSSCRTAREPTPSACGSQVADGCSTHWTPRPPP